MTDVSCIPDSAFPVTPSDDKGVSFMTLYIGQEGDVALCAEGGQSVILENVPTGTLIPLRVCKVMATGTTAKGIVGFK